ncbi:hypothetical protein [Paenibacillus tundrae]|uniref:Uncharacterized protein n=1 Tax=Paenibacillus tundrae TaxID=528187 RepID=A0ABT9W7W8_9BACL|nr:hypothetical protein [Paenibacillus tundrae]MDQ0169321.1 hypothetical protein [Paenibacillus tundrae]
MIGVQLFVHSTSELAKWQAITLEELPQNALVMYPKVDLGERFGG